MPELSRLQEDTRKLLDEARRDPACAKTVLRVLEHLAARVLLAEGADLIPEELPTRPELRTPYSGTYSKVGAVEKTLAVVQAPRR